jgi:ornithine cyclodeaminase/alanine dehydrogenase-like protein (mu-crystallin family)
VDNDENSAKAALDLIQDKVKVECAIAGLETACQQADVIITATPSRKPIVMKEWVRPGTHLACMGSDLDTKIELEPQLTASAFIIGDEPDHVLKRGEVSQSVSSGLLGEDCLAGSIKQVVTGVLRGRPDEQAITLYDGVGVGYQDTAILQELYAEAVRTGAGLPFTFS